MLRDALRAQGRLSGLIPLLMLVQSIAGCSSGGGDGDTPQSQAPVTYTGITSPAAITQANANTLFAVLWGSAKDSVPTVGGVQPSSPSDSTIRMSLARRVRLVIANRPTLAAGALSAGVAVHYTLSGTVSGSARVSGNMNSDGTGLFTISYVNFNDGFDITMDGLTTVEVLAYDESNQLITDMNVIAAPLRIRDPSEDLSIQGSIRGRIDLTNQSDTMTMNLDGRDNVSQATFRFADLVLADFFDNVLNPTTFTEVWTGRVYEDTEGYVDVTTVAPLQYASDAQEVPDSGGPMRLTGADAARAELTPLSTTQAQIAFDPDGDDPSAPVVNQYLWADLAGPPVQ